MYNDAITTYQQLLKNTSAEYSAGAINSNIMSQLESLVTAQCKCPSDRHYKAIHAQVQNVLDEFYAPLYEK